MAGKEGKSREARVMGILKQMEKSIVKEESQACRLLYNIEEKLRNIVSDVDLKVLSDIKCDSPKKAPTTGRVWSLEPRDLRRPWTEAGKNKKTPSMRNLKQFEKTIAHNEKQSGDGLKMKSKEESDTSLCTTSSKVQQLKLFWDKFFLTEMEPVRSRELIDKSQFLSEAKCEVLEKPRRKSMRKSAAKILEKTIPPSRVPISFRMISSKQNRSRKKIEKDDNFSDVDLILSREVSTYVAKIPESSEESSDTCSEYSLAESQSIREPVPPEVPAISDLFKEKLYRHFLSRQVAELSLEISEHEQMVDKEDKKKIYQHVETGRKIGCAHKKGCVLIMKGEVPLQCYTEYLAIRSEEVNLIDPSVILTSKKPERKPRKVTTLLPCYYFTVENNLPFDMTARGDQSLTQDDKNKQENTTTPVDHSYFEDCRMRTTLSYEKITFSSSADLDKSQFKLIISKEEPAARLSVLIIFTFSSVTILGFIVIVLNFFQGSLLFC